MFYEPTSYSDDLAEENIHFMEDDIVFKIVVICIATVYILQRRGKLNLCHLNNKKKHDSSWSMLW